jgi:hypothetical protein
MEPRSCELGSNGEAFSTQRNQERIEQLLRLCVSCLSVGWDLAHVIPRSLKRIGLPFFSLDDEDHAYHISGGRDVE